MTTNRAFQPVHQQLASFSIAAGANFTAKLRDLYTQIDGRIGHLAGFLIEVALTPTFTTSPTQAGTNKILSLVEFFDGRQIRFRGTGNDLRQFERLEHGGELSAQPGLAATGNPRYFSRYLPVGPDRFSGAPSDFLIPSALLMNGELRVQCGALTDVSADTTAVSGTIIVTAVIIPLDEIRIPPFYERQTYTLNSDDRISGKGLYAFVGISKSSAYDAFIAADLSNILVETGTFAVVNTVNASVLSRMFNVQMGGQQVGGVQGEPLNATYDAAQRAINQAGATALIAGIADLQPALWCMPGTRITKIAARVDNAMRIKSPGTITSGLKVHVSRFLPQGPDVINAMQAECERQLNVRGKLKIKTISKDAYSGPHAAYMPWAVSL